MYNVGSNLVLGFHGCDQVVCETLLNNPNRIRISRESFDWLGHGMYFWENNYARAWDWARYKYERGEINSPAVIGAVLDLGYCCDFLSTEHIEMFKDSYKKLFDLYKASNKVLPKNKNLREDKHKDKLLREMDCVVIEHMCEDIIEQMENDLTVHGFTKHKLPDSVRGAFLEGSPAFEGSGIYEKTHIQIAIRNPNCIKGFFLPRRERISLNSDRDIGDISDNGFFVSEPRIPYNA